MQDFLKISNILAKNASERILFFSVVLQYMLNIIEHFMFYHPNIDDLDQYYKYYVSITNSIVLY